jgi:hypothetical protein
MSNSTRRITAGTRQGRRLALFVSACSLLLLCAAFLAMPLTVSADHGGGGNGGTMQNDNHGRDGHGKQADKNDDRGNDVVDRDNDKNMGNDVDNNDNDGNNAVDNDVNDDRGNDFADNDDVAMMPPMPGIVVTLPARVTDR